MKLFGASIVLLFLIADFCAAQSIEFRSDDSDCLTPSGRTGNCIRIQDCKNVINILTSNTILSEERVKFLRSLQCGFEGTTPKVCCERNTQETTTRFPDTSTANIDVPETASAVAAPPDVTGHANLQLLDHRTCGPLTQWRIINGNKTKVLDYPWMALIAYRIRSNNEFRCGGTVINKRYVLTAAHCVTDLPSGLVLTGVRLGDHDISTEQDCDVNEQGLKTVCAEPYQDFGIESSHPHSGYSRRSLQNDIALIRLDREADFRPNNVRPICLPISSTNIEQRKVVVTGWGATERGPQSNALLQIFIDLVPNDECARIYQKDTQITYKQMCAGGTNATDSCFGDSGGPLQSIGTYNNNPKFVQYGIISFGRSKCGEEGYPGVYTNLAYFLNWVLDTMKP